MTQVAPQLNDIANGSKNRLFPKDEAAHRWYRFVLSFPPQLVREYIDRFHLTRKSLVLDPFCGTGTTLVEAKKQGVRSVGLEAHPMPAFASGVKTEWSPDPRGLLEHAGRVAAKVEKRLASGTETLRSLPPETDKLLLKGSIGPLPLHKTLALLDELRGEASSLYYKHERLSLANALVQDIGNLHFGPEVGVSKKKKDDAPVVASWLSNVRTMAEDLEELRGKEHVPSTVWCHDSRHMLELIPDGSVDGVITSPPYPNEKDYTRTTRLESVILGLIHDRKGLRQLKQGLLRSNTRNVYRDDRDDRWIDGFPKIKKIAEQIERRRIALGKTSGFERLYARVTKLYFGGMAQHLSVLRRALRPGARLAYVVGDQASFLRVMIRTGQLLGEIAESLGYEVEALDLFRTRFSTTTKEQLREEVLVLRWPG